MEVRIETRNLNLWYGDFQALKEINLKIFRNKVTSIIGPSGCGKSSFIKTLNRMVDIVEGAKVEGEVLLDGENIYSNQIDIIELRRKIGMVFQKPNPFPKSIWENIAYGPKVHGLKDRKELHLVVRESLKRAALFEEVRDKLSTSALELSGGQQQRLCIARTLAVKPEVILFDEPCSALDPISTAKIEDLIHDLKKRYTII
ncbi:MAG: phosphate ABC transporter ATP-binding protein, partial [Candidatus Methanofastidiosia archaeon]